MADPVAGLTNSIIQTTRFSLDDFRRCGSVELAFDYLRERLEAAGIFVLLLGNLGSYHTNIPSDTFRGFAIADRVAPFVVVNDQDARAAWSFTALHEVVHLWLGTTGVSGASAEVGIERYCNDVAGELLLPAAEIGQIERVGRLALEDAVEAVSEFARLRRISRAMVAYKLLRTDAITEAKWRGLSDRFRRDWLASRARQEDEPRNAGGPSYYVIKRHRLGGALLDLVRHSLGDGILTYTKAGQVLGVKARNVDPLLHGSPLPAGQ
jgi:Zn-dependent peptidase ImmA (M78 family)